MAVAQGIDRSGAAGGMGATSMVGMLGRLTDPGADRLLLWDDSAEKLDWLSPSDAVGASLVGFAQSGTAPTHGFASRTVQAKEMDVVSLLDFKNSGGGAVTLDGVTDNTTGLQSALDWVHSQAKGALYTPAGTCLTGEIDWPGNGIALLGAGSGYAYNSNATPRTIFKAKAGTTKVFDLVQ